MYLPIPVRSYSTLLSLTLLFFAPAVNAQEKTPKPKQPLQIEGITVTPHVRASSMRFSSEAGSATGARVQIFVRNTDSHQTVSTNEVLFKGKYPLKLLMDGEWAWHDTPNSWGGAHLTLPPGALTVWSYNSIRTGWGAGSSFPIQIEDWGLGTQDTYAVTLTKPLVWLSAITFLGDSVQPDKLVFHIENRSSKALKIEGARLYLPKSADTWRVFYPQTSLRDLLPFSADGIIPPKDKGGAEVVTGKLPLTYCVLEVTLKDPKGQPLSLWAKLRIKREAFDISGGWVTDSHTRDDRPSVLHEAFLKTLKRLHINTAHIGMLPGYTDQIEPNGLYSRYPLKFFGGLEPISAYDTDANLSRVHGVESLGEPQYGGGSGQKMPQEVLRALEKYAPSRFATTLTLSDEANWRYYAGLSDYPHYDAYRVTAPSPDSWRRYERWGETRIGWGAPLETIGDMCRSLREMSRPAPTAYWSQGPHQGWDVYDGRQRTSPTPDELRLQAYHALASRITSLYWFNLSLRSLVLFRDTLDEVARVGREIKMLESFYLKGDAYQYRQLHKEGKPDWDLASIVSPEGALLFALDLDYTPDPIEKVFRFHPPRPAEFAFELPSYLRRPVDVFRIDADGVHEVAYHLTKHGVTIQDKTNRVAIYVATPSRNLRTHLEKRRQQLLAEEESTHFDPASNNEDFATLKSISRP